MGYHIRPKQKEGFLEESHGILASMVGFALGPHREKGNRVIWEWCSKEGTTPSREICFYLEPFQREPWLKPQQTGFGSI